MLKDLVWRESSWRRSFSFAYSVEPLLDRRACGKALELFPEELLHGLALECCAGRQFVSDLIRNIADRDLDRHAVILPSLPALCKQSVGLPRPRIAKELKNPLASLALAQLGKPPAVDIKH